MTEVIFYFFRILLAWVGTLKESVERLNDVGKNSETFITDMVNERAILEKDSEKNLAKIEQLENQILELDRAQLETSQKLGETIKNLHERDEKVKKIQQKINLVNSEKEDAKRTAEGWNNRYLTSAAKVSELEKKIKLLEETTQRAQLSTKEREKQVSILKSENETLQKARDNSMKQSERLILQVNSFEKELTTRRAKEAELKSQILTLEQQKRNTLQKENETHEKFIHANAKFEKEKKLKNELEQTIERLQEEIRYSTDAREDLTNKNQIFKRKITENDGEMAKILQRLDDVSEKYAESESESLKLKRDNQKMVQDLFDARSTVTELGRTHAQIQVAWNNEKTRQWVDDASVSECPECTSEFSLLIRKHHCRKCGGIFCWQCSNYTLVLPSSNKPQRVCQACSIAT